MGSANAQPFLVGNLVNYISGYGSSSAQEAYGFAVGVFSLALVNVVTNTILFQRTYVMGMRLRIMLGTQLYKKVS